MVTHYQEVDPAPTRSAENGIVTCHKGFATTMWTRPSALKQYQPEVWSVACSPPFFGSGSINQQVSQLVSDHQPPQHRFDQNSHVQPRKGCFKNGTLSWFVLCINPLHATASSSKPKTMGRNHWFFTCAFWKKYIQRFTKRLALPPPKKTDVDQRFVGYLRIIGQSNGIEPCISGVRSYRVLKIAKPLRGQDT